MINEESSNEELRQDNESGLERFHKRRGGQDPSENGNRTGLCPEVAPFMGQGSKNEPECIAAREVKDGTTPKSIYPHDENETSLKAEISDPSVINDQVEEVTATPYGTEKVPGPSTYSREKVWVPSLPII